VWVPCNVWLSFCTCRASSPKPRTGSFGFTHPTVRRVSTRIHTTPSEFRLAAVLNQAAVRRLRFAVLVQAAVRRAILRGKAERLVRFPQPTLVRFPQPTLFPTTNTGAMPTTNMTRAGRDPLPLQPKQECNATGNNEPREQERVRQHGSRQTDLVLHKGDQRGNNHDHFLCGLCFVHNDRRHIHTKVVLFSSVTTCLGRPYVVH
jgi:hypothetical protein